MGRDSTGAITTGQCLQVPISVFKTAIKSNNKVLEGTINYDSGSSIGARFINTNINYSITFFYTKTIEGKKHHISYNVSLTSVKSNLGKGEVFYFICPFTGVRCKTLYMGYGSLHFKSLRAYSHRIYYRSQLSSYLDKHNDKYWNLERKLQNLYERHPKTHYRNIPTKAQLRIDRLESKMDYHDHMRWCVLPQSLIKAGIRLR